MSFNFTRKTDGDDTVYSEDVNELQEAIEQTDVSVASLDGRVESAEGTLTEQGGRLTTAEAVQVSQGRGLDQPFSRRSLGVFPKVMASPPTVTVGTGGAASSISSAVTLLPDSNNFLQLRHAGYSVTGGIYLPTGFAQTQATAALEFMFDGSEFEIYCRDDTATIRIMVDGEYVSYTATALTTSGANRHILVDFGIAAIRHIRLETASLALRGIKVPPTSTVWRPATRTEPRVIMLGDSYLGGVDGIGLNLGHFLNWPDVWEDNVGGTGYLKVNGIYEALPDRLDTDLFPHNPDIAIIAMGLNDQTTYTESQIQTAAEGVFDSIRSTLPDAILIVVGPWWPSGSPTTGIINTRNAIQTAANGRAHLFIDNIGATAAGVSTLGWITGTGKIGSTTGSGNADLYINADGTHPSAAGRLYLANRLARSIVAAMPILGVS